MNDLDARVGGLTGATLDTVGRALNVGVFEFTGSAGEKVRLHIQCPFRLLHESRIILGSDDIKYPYSDSLVVETAEECKTMFDARTQTFNSLLKSLRTVVSEATVGVAGKLNIGWRPAFLLEIFPSCSGSVEMWRLVAPGGTHYGYPEDLI